MDSGIVRGIHLEFRAGVYTYSILLNIEKSSGSGSLLSSYYYSTSTSISGNF